MPRPDVLIQSDMDHSWDLIKQEINSGRVVCASIKWRGFGGHAVVVWGYSEDTVSGTRKVSVLDPLDLPVCLSFDSFITSFRGAGHCSELTLTKVSMGNG